jgi:oxalate decarboxylase/phosphoglucose isomerase-like protein (cupin superfamily)
MRFKLASEHDGRTFVLILDQGEEALAAITVDGTAADQDQERHRRITDSSVFPVSKTIAAALVEVQPGGMRELLASQHQ